eukprot:2996902-Amphidinium_carterae.2
MVKHVTVWSGVHFGMLLQEMVGGLMSRTCDRGALGDVGKERLETLPLFATLRGTAVEKDSMVDTVECAAKQLGLEMRREEGGWPA